MALSKTYSVDSQVPDSASTMTALACLNSADMASRLDEFYRLSAPFHLQADAELVECANRIADKQQIALYPADVLPPAEAIGVPVKLMRKEAIARGKTAETPAHARARVGRRAR